MRTEKLELVENEIELFDNYVASAISGLCASDKFNLSQSNLESLSKAALVLAQNTILARREFITTIPKMKISIATKPFKPKPIKPKKASTLQA